MKTVAIVQARMGSSRLAGKALEFIGPYSVLGWVIRRTLKVRGVDEIIVATTDLTEDDVIARFVAVAGLPCYRGSADDLLERYSRAADKTEATHILRVTADCPLLCPDLNSRIVDCLHQTDKDYVSISTRSNGFVQEAFTREALTEANVMATLPHDREHVVPYMIRNLKTRFLACDHDLGNARWCVDTPGDLKKLRLKYHNDADLFNHTAYEILGYEFATTNR